MDKLLKYGNLLLKSKKNEEAIEYFLKCYELDPKNYNVCLRIFNYYIYNYEYDTALKYFDIMYSNASEENKNMLNYYLYLLSMFVVLPDKYKEKAKELEFKDIKVKENSNDYNYNLIRNLIINHKLKKALYSYQKIKEKLSQEESLARTLTIHACEERNLSLQQMLNFINEENYEQLIDYLEFVSDCHNLNKLAQNVLNMAEDLIEMRRTGIIPLPSNANNYFDALNAKDYKKCLQTFQEDKKNNNNPQYLLLKKINEYIKSQERLTNFDEESIYSFINSKKEYLNKFGMILLEPMSDEQLNKLMDVIKKISDIKYYSIEENEKKRIIIVLINPFYENINIKKIDQEGDLAYKRGDNDICIQNYRKIMMNVRIKSINLFKVGISYYRKGYHSVALDYLIAADGIAKKEGLNCDYTSLIMNLKNKLMIDDNSQEPEETSPLSLKLEQNNN